MYILIINITNDYWWLHQPCLPINLPIKDRFYNPFRNMLKVACKNQTWLAGNIFTASFSSGISQPRLMIPRCQTVWAAACRSRGKVADLLGHWGRKTSSPNLLGCVVFMSRIQDATCSKRLGHCFACHTSHTHTLDKKWSIIGSVGNWIPCKQN